MDITPSVAVEVAIPVPGQSAPYRDVLRYSLAEWPSITPQRIQADAQARLTAWQAAVAAAPPDPEDENALVGAELPLEVTQ